MMNPEAPPRAWVLNLDAEHELEARAAYAPTRRLQAIVAAQRPKARAALLRPQDVLVTEENAAWRPHPAAGLPGFARSPTPRALALLRTAGAVPALEPSRDLLRDVNARPFAASLHARLLDAHGSPLEGLTKRVVHDLDAALERLAVPAERGWQVRRTFGAAGRGRRRITGGRAAALDDAERSWLRAGLRLGPLVIEPLVDVRAEFTRSAWVDAGGRLHDVAPCLQTTDANGAWRTSEAVGPSWLSKTEDGLLERTLEAASMALHASGYVGPFGIDAFRYRHGGRTLFQPLSEINARFTMDWTRGMQTRTPHPTARELDAVGRT